MTLTDIKIQAELDVIIDTNHLDDESSRIPQLHNKYLCILMDEKIIYETLDSKLKILKRDEWLYYAGKMSKEELTKRAWEPFDLSILKQDLDRFIESDIDVITLGNKIFVQKEKVSYLESVVKIIANKIWNIRSTIDWIRFTQGS
jgi:hypothetical protein